MLKYTYCLMCYESQSCGAHDSEMDPLRTMMMAAVRRTKIACYALGVSFEDLMNRLGCNIDISIFMDTSKHGCDLKRKRSATSGPTRKSTADGEIFTSPRCSHTPFYGNSNQSSNVSPKLWRPLPASYAIAPA